MQLPISITRLEHIAWEALSAGEHVLLSLFQNLKPSDISYKKNREIVTRADLESNRAILRILRRNTPTFDIISEESAPRQRSNCVWILDPLDGTTNYAAQLPLWGISLACTCDHEIEFGVISLPLLGERYLAIRGKGAWRMRGGKKERLHVSKTRKLKDALGLLCAGYQKEKIRRSERTSSHLALASHSLRRLGAAVVEATWVATGRADYSVLEGVRPWDVAAGALIVKEAGGIVTQPNGKPWTLNEPNILFSNPYLAKSLHLFFKSYASHESAHHSKREKE